MNNNAEDAVAEFIKDGEWNMDKLQSRLMPFDVEEIIKIPVSKMGVDDHLVWHYTHNGRYIYSKTSILGSPNVPFTRAIIK